MVMSKYFCPPMANFACRLFIQCLKMIFSLLTEYRTAKHVDSLLIYEADPQLWPVVIIVFAHVVRSYVSPSVPTFQNKTNFKRNCTLLARQWVWPSGSPVLFSLFSS